MSTVMKYNALPCRLFLICVAVGLAGSMSCILPFPLPSTCDDIDQCCDPATKPGAGDNPICVEGVRCCADGQWACNQGDGSSTCDAPGCECNAADLCCDPASKPGPLDCEEGSHCCANGEWSCDLGDGTSLCEAPGTECEVCGGIAGIPCTDPRDYCKLNDGECCCDFQGICATRPDACIEIFEPVCGCDGETYSNSCFAEMAGVSVDHAGECP